MFHDIMKSAVFSIRSIYMKHKRILPLVEGALVIALGTVLSLVTVFKLPWGGSVTLLIILFYTEFNSCYIT